MTKLEVMRNNLPLWWIALTEVSFYAFSVWLMWKGEYSASVGIWILIEIRSSIWWLKKYGISV